MNESPCREGFLRFKDSDFKVKDKVCRVKPKLFNPIETVTGKRCRLRALTKHCLNSTLKGKSSQFIEKQDFLFHENFPHLLIL